MSQFQPTIAQVLYGAEYGHFALPAFAESMFDGIRREWERVFWNTQQKSWDDHKGEPFKLGRVYWQPYVWDRCDCGGQYPNHLDECEYLTGHDEWNAGRLKWAEVPKSEDEEAEKKRVAEELYGKDSWMAAIANAGRELDTRKLFSNDYPVPHPPCTCGASNGWQGYDCLPACVSRLPNFGILGDPVQIRWYKYPGRGMSVNVALTNEEWIAWHDRVMDALDECEHASEIERYRDELKGRCMRYPCKRCGKGQ